MWLDDETWVGMMSSREDRYGGKGLTEFVALADELNPNTQPANSTADAD